LHIANWDKIRDGEVTDVYFRRAVEILKAKDIHKHVTAEVRAPRFPDDYTYAVLAGIEESAHLLEGVNVDVSAMDEGTVFQPGEPVMFVHFLSSCMYLLLESTDIILTDWNLRAVFHFQFQSSAKPLVNGCDMFYIHYK